MECPLWRLLISSRSVSKHGHHIRLFEICFHFAGPSEFLPDLHFLCKIEISNLHRGYSIDDFYQVSVVAMFFNQSGRNEQSSCRKHLWKVLFKECTFCYDPLPNMAATGNSCFWLADFNLHRGYSIDDFYQVSVVAMFFNQSGWNEQSS
jgi:hypothetical protein